MKEECKVAAEVRYSNWELRLRRERERICSLSQPDRLLCAYSRKRIKKCEDCFLSLHQRVKIRSGESSFIIATVFIRLLIIRAAQKIR